MDFDENTKLVKNEEDKSDAGGEAKKGKAKKPKSQVNPEMRAKQQADADAKVAQKEEAKKEQKEQKKEEKIKAKESGTSAGGEQTIIMP